MTADGVVGLTRAFLAAGVQCVCVSLWPVPIAASKLFTHTFYTALLNGTKASAALTEAMKTLQGSKHFSHPSNWAGEQTTPHSSTHKKLKVFLLASRGLHHLTEYAQFSDKLINLVIVFSTIISV